jgi:serine/threonine protein kinase
LDTQRWLQIEELFHRACECDPGQRAHLLEETGNDDPELRRTLERLLANEERAAEGLQAAVFGGLDAVAFPLVGDTISHYRILAGIGTGGMGSVYRAEDIRLGRQVALKFLAEEFARDSAALGRFEREARSASALEHPNICPVYEFGEHAGQPFLVMPLLQGETLRELLGRRAPAPLETPELLALSLQIAAALDAAHRHGMIHRDIKPANIFVTTQGEAKVLDFGLAKPVHWETAEDESRGTVSLRANLKDSGPTALSSPEAFLTRSGSAIGTSAYMSPEQARGERLDARTDIFSFGLVLYEMATGQRALHGATEPILHDAILQQSPAPAWLFNPTLPARLEAIIERALEKDCDARYATAAHLRADLAAVKQATEGRRARRSRLFAAAAAVVLMIGAVAVTWFAKHILSSPAMADTRFRRLTVNPSENGVTSGASSPNRKYSLVVLPLENLSGDKEQEYLADGITDALTTDLAQIGSLRVISRTSAMHFKGSKETLPQIGRDLQVDAVVEGTVGRGENRVRVTAQLVEASSDQHLWARTYERDLKDALALQDEIAQDITEQIRVKLSPKERSRLMRVHAVDPEAYDAYLRGRYWANQADIWTGCKTSAGCYSQTEPSKALEYYQKAIAKDPSYALGYAGVADGFVVMATSGGLSYKEASAKISEAALKAIALDPSLAEPHSSLSFIKLFNDWDWSGAEAESKQAIALNPNFARAHLWYSYCLVSMARLDEAVNESERARDLDPFDYFVNEWLGQALYHARRYDDALRQMRRTFEMFPNRGNRLYWEIGEVYEQKRVFPEAFAARQQALGYDKDPNATALGEAYKRAGYRGWLLKAAQLEEQRQLTAGYNYAQLTHMYAMLDDEPHAMSYLERAYEAHRPNILFVRTSPELDSIRSSPRFRELVSRIGFPPSPSDKN